MRADTERADPGGVGQPEALKLRRSRVGPAIAFVCSLALVTVMIWFWDELFGDSAMAWLALGLPMYAMTNFALGLHPDTGALIIDKDGITMLWPLRKPMRHAWSEIVDFRVVNIEGDDYVGYDLVEKRSARRRKPLLLRMLRFGKTDHYLLNYRVPPSELAATLNRFREHYAGDDAA